MKASSVSLTVGERAQAVTTLGQLLRVTRLERGISGNELIKRAQISRSYLTKIENGTLQDLRLDKFCRITEALGVEADEVLREAGYLMPKPRSPLPDPEDYLRERYKLSPDAVDQALDFLEWLGRRERQARRASQ